MADPTKTDAYRKLDEAIAALAQWYVDEDGENWIPTDAVLVIGSQQYDEDGDRVGSIRVFPRNGCQPTYITAGLLDSAKTFLYNATSPSSD